MEIAITGATGTIGSALRASLESDGHRVIAITRGASGADAIHWDVDAEVLDTQALEGIDGIVHLAGHPLGRPRWTDGYLRKVRESRVRGTNLLVERLASMQRPPAVLVSGSAVGFYGSRGDEVLTEESSRGQGELADICVAWEQAAAPVQQAGVRLATIRTGIVVSPHGGAFGPLLLPFRLGLGGRLGSGRQWWPWISLADEVRAIRFLLDGPHEGPFNLSGPAPAQVTEIVRAMGEQLRRPTVLPIPSFALRAGAGRRMADEMILVSQRMVPARLQEAGFTFTHGTFAEAFAQAMQDRREAAQAS